MYDSGNHFSRTGWQLVQLSFKLRVKKKFVVTINSLYLPMYYWSMQGNNRQIKLINRVVIIWVLVQGFLSNSVPQPINNLSLKLRRTRDFFQPVTFASLVKTLDVFILVKSCDVWNPNSKTWRAQARLEPVSYEIMLVQNYDVRTPSWN